MSNSKGLLIVLGLGIILLSFGLALLDGFDRAAQRTFAMSAYHEWEQRGVIDTNLLETVSGWHPLKGDNMDRASRYWHPPMHPLPELKLVLRLALVGIGMFMMWKGSRQPAVDKEINSIR